MLHCIHVHSFYILMTSYEHNHPWNRVRCTIAGSGISIAEWARANGFSCGLVYQVLEGRRKCLRGQSYRIAVALGIKPGQPLDVAALSRLLAQGVTAKSSTESYSAGDTEENEM